MDTPLRALFVAASATDVEPLLEELARNGHEVSWEVVCNAVEMKAALARDEWDLVLSDDEIPGFGALPALALTQAAGLDVPFLVVSGEEVRERVIRAGASDCLASDPLAKLASSVERELAASRLRRERRLARRALGESESRFRALAETATDAILTADGDGRIVFANRAAETVFGQPVAAIVGRPIERLVPGILTLAAAGPEGTPAPDRVLGQAFGVHSSGREIPLEVSIGILARDGRPFTTVIARDVTERRNAERALRESEARKSAMIEAALDAILSLDAAGNILEFNAAAERMFGYSRSDVLGKSMAELLIPSSLRERHRRGMAHLATGEAPIFGKTLEVTAMRRDGTEFPIELTVTRLPSEGPPVFTGYIHDLTDRRRAESALRESEELYRTLFERNLAGVFRSSLDGRILECNDSFARIFGYASPQEALHKPALDFYLRPGDRKTFLARLSERRTVNNHEMCARRRDGTPVWVLENATLVEGPDGAGSLIEGTVIDITDRKRAEEQVKHLAFHDALTGLPNRLLLNDRLTIALAQSHRSRQKLAILYLDIDRFKVINDSLGHTIGDELLRRVAERLRACVREGDTVARLGGDEFVILVSRISSDGDAATVAQKILAAVRLPFGVEQRDYFLTTSVGVSLYPNDGVDGETLLQNADTAMYRAKEQGRDNFQLYAPAMNARAADRLSLENRLRKALQNDELLLHYQPIVDLRNGRVRGAEALLRWQHPERGLLPPAEFISLAEVSGLISPIGRWVLETACKQARDWQILGNPRFTVSVNLSPRQFLQTDLVSQVAAALSSSGLDAGSLDLEITESNAMENAEVTVNTLWELRRLGVGISMDDFGTGYSSLNYLKRFPIDRVKLDRSFVRDVVTNPEDAAIVRAVISMAHTLRLVVAAEGVENEDQLAFLRDHRCDEMQGFLFSPPVEPLEFQKLLTRRQPLPAIA